MGGPPVSLERANEYRSDDVPYVQQKDLSNIVRVTAFAVTLIAIISLVQTIGFIPAIIVTLVLLNKANNFYDHVVEYFVPKSTAEPETDEIEVATHGLATSALRLLTRTLTSLSPMKAKTPKKAEKAPPTSIHGIPESDLSTVVRLATFAGSIFAIVGIVQTIGFIPAIIIILVILNKATGFFDQIVNYFSSKNSSANDENPTKKTANILSSLSGQTLDALAGVVNALSPSKAD